MNNLALMWFIRIPIILVGNKSDLRSGSSMETILPIMNQFSEIETCVEVRLKSVSVLSVTTIWTWNPRHFFHTSHWFSYSSAPQRTWKTSQSCSTMHRRPSFTPPHLFMILKTNRSAIFGTEMLAVESAYLFVAVPLFTLHKSDCFRCNSSVFLILQYFLQLKPLCVRALSRIFYVSDQDNDRILSDDELNCFQVPVNSVTSMSSCVVVIIGCKTDVGNKYNVSNLMCRNLVLGIL